MKGTVDFQKVRFFHHNCIKRRVFAKYFKNLSLLDIFYRKYFDTFGKIGLMTFAKEQFVGKKIDQTQIGVLIQSLETVKEIKDFEFFTLVAYFLNKARIRKETSYIFERQP